MAIGLTLRTDQVEFTLGRTTRKVFPKNFEEEFRNRHIHYLLVGNPSLLNVKGAGKSGEAVTQDLCSFGYPQRVDKVPRLVRYYFNARLHVQ